MDDNAIHLVTMPKWGLAMQEGTIIEWRKAEGDSVVAGEPLCDIETTKITNEFELPFSGTLARIASPIGSTVNVGDVIAVIANGVVDAGEITTLLESRARSSRSESEADNRPAVRKVTTAAGSFAYLETGSAEADSAVLFLHGFGGDHTNWGQLQGEAPAARRAIAIDLPGHGGSSRNVGSGSAEDIADRVGVCTDALGLRRINLVAHSFGGAVALHLAAQRPAQVASLMLIAPAILGARANPDYIRGFLAAERKRDMKPVLEMLFSDPRMVGRTMVNDALALLRDNDAHQALEQIGARLLQEATNGLEHDVGVLESHLVMIVWGNADAVIPMPSGLAARFGARLRVIPGAGHMPHAERPGLVGEALRALIAQG